MDYEKKYKETLERAKNCLKDGTITNTAKSYIEEIFPEFKESEDERIRKAIIELIYKHPDGTKEMCAWLEKQGEQKPAWSEEDELRLNTICNILAGLDEQRNWLKSLKERYTWKPSDEQMKVLDEVIRNPHLSTDEYNGLIALKEQLRVQKGEEV